MAIVHSATSRPWMAPKGVFRQLLTEPSKAGELLLQSDDKEAITFLEDRGEILLAKRCSQNVCSNVCKLHFRKKLLTLGNGAI